MAGAPVLHEITFLQLHNFTTSQAKNIKQAKVWLKFLNFGRKTLMFLLKNQKRPMTNFGNQSSRVHTQVDFLFGMAMYTCVNPVLGQQIPLRSTSPPVPLSDLY